MYTPKKICRFLKIKKEKKGRSRKGKVYSKKSSVSGTDLKYTCIKKIRNNMNLNLTQYRFSMHHFESENIKLTTVSIIIMVVDSFHVYTSSSLPHSLILLLFLAHCLLF